MTQTNDGRLPGHLQVLKSRLQKAWAAGDYSRIGTTLQIVGERLAEAMDLSAGMRVVDVAAGNGNASLAAARRWCEVTAIDIVPALLDQLSARAAAEGLDIACREADADHLPFADGSIDATMSTFGAMFAPLQPLAAAELIRVTRPGGRVGLANWTPDGFVGRFFALLARYSPPPAGLAMPTRWGTDTFVQEHFAGHCAALRIERRDYVFRYRSPGHWLAVFSRCCGITRKTLASLEPALRQSLCDDILRLIDRFNRATDGSMVVASDYLEVVMQRRPRPAVGSRQGGGS